jgi:hypothetical protein
VRIQREQGAGRDSGSAPELKTTVHTPFAGSRRSIRAPWCRNMQAGVFVSAGCRMLSVAAVVVHHSPASSPDIMSRTGGQAHLEQGINIYPSLAHVCPDRSTCQPARRRPPLACNFHALDPPSRKVRGASVHRHLHRKRGNQARDRLVVGRTIEDSVLCYPSSCRRTGRRANVLCSRFGSEAPLGRGNRNESLGHATRERVAACHDAVSVCTMRVRPLWIQQLALTCS